MTGKYERLMALWEIRACFICDQVGICRHREIEADWAEVNGLATAPRLEPPSIPRFEKRPIAREVSHSAKSSKPG
jgi:hypothetical protein